MKIWFDTEFMEDGRTIELLSIGAVREDGAVYYAENAEADHSKANDWVRANVLPHLLGTAAGHPRRFIADSFREFCGAQPEFWAYYSDYDWVALCQLYGRMVDLPNGWPMFCRDVKQLCLERGNPKLPARDPRVEHHALQDAQWAKAAWEFLQSARPEEGPIKKARTLTQDEEIATQQAMVKFWREKYQNAVMECWTAINEKIKPGALHGSGWDETATRNGLILATNILMELRSTMNSDGRKE